MSSERRLTPSEVQLVLRRAAELERREPGDEGLRPAELQELAREVGLSPQAVEQALAEQRAGALTVPEPPRALERLLGPQQLLVERSVPGGSDDVQRRLERALRGQMLTRSRDFGARSLWVPSQGLLSKVRRAFDFAGELALAELKQLEASVIDSGDGRCTVRLVVDVGALQRRVVGGAALGATLGIGAAVALWALHGPVPLEWLAAAGFGGTGALSSLRLYRKQVTATATALERLLDALEHPRPPSNPLDALFAR